MATIADYNNNPGNIKPPKGVTYDGQIGVDDRGFAIFETKDFGRKALVNDIETKIQKGLVTPEAFINRYAPAGTENDEDARMNYKIFLADQLGLKSTADKFPEDSAHKIADAIAHFEAGTRPAPTTETQPAPSTQPNFDAAKLPSSNTEGNPQAQEIPPYVGGIIGGVTGATAGTSAAVAKAKYDAAREAYDTIKQRVSPTSAVTSVTPANTVVASETGLIPSAEQHERAIQGTTKEKGITGRASQTTYQLRTQEIAEQAAREKRKMEALRRARLIASEVPNLNTYGSVASTPSGVIAPTAAVESLQAAQVAPPVSQKSSPLWAYARRLGAMPIKGGLMGLGAGYGAADAYNRARAGEPEEATVSGLGTVASLLAPYVASAGALPAAGIAAPLYLTASDRIKRLAKHPEEVQLQEDAYDAMGNPLR